MQEGPASASLQGSFITAINLRNLRKFLIFGQKISVVNPAKRFQEIFASNAWNSLPFGKG